MNKKEKFVAYLGVITLMFLITLLAVLLDILTAYQGENLQVITFFGISATKQEWWQNLFLVGFFTIAVPLCILTGWYTGKQDLELHQVGILLILLYPLLSALWDIAYYYWFIIPTGFDQTYVGPWFDPFDLAIALGTMVWEQGYIGMDVEFMLTFAVLRVFIFLPILLYSIRRFLL